MGLYHMFSVKTFKSISWSVLAMKILSFLLIDVSLLSGFSISNSFLIYGYLAALGYAAMDGSVSKWICMLALAVGLAWIVLAVYLIFCRRVVRVAWLEAALYLSETALGVRYLINLAVSGDPLYPIPLIIISACMTVYCVASAAHDRRAKSGSVKECVDADGMTGKTGVSADSDAHAHSTESNNAVPTEVDAGVLHCSNGAPLKQRRLRKVLISLADGLLNAAAAFLIIFLFSKRFFSASEFGISEMLLILIPAVVVSLAVGLLLIPRFSGGIDMPSAFVSCAAAFALFLLVIVSFSPFSGVASSYRLFSDYSVVCGRDISLLFLYTAYIIRVTLAMIFSLIHDFGK